jgi:hypothetical protein
MRASARQFILGYVELVGLAFADDENPLAAFDDLAFDGAVEEPVPQSIDDDFFKKCQRLGDLPVVGSGRCRDGRRLIHGATAPSSLDSGRDCE